MTMVALVQIVYHLLQRPCMNCMFHCYVSLTLYSMVRMFIGKFMEPSIHKVVKGRPHSSVSH